MSTLAAPTRKDGLSARCAAAWRGTAAARRIATTTRGRCFMVRSYRGASLTRGAWAYSLDQQTLRLSAGSRHLEIAKHRCGIGLVRVLLACRARELGDPGAIVGTVELGVIGHKDGRASRLGDLAHLPLAVAIDREVRRLPREVERRAAGVGDRQRSS